MNGQCKYRVVRAGVETCIQCAIGIEPDNSCAFSPPIWVASLLAGLLLPSACTTSVWTTPFALGLKSASNVPSKFSRAI